jgi:capsular exopolysaccharide synthesis family protein
LDYCAAEIILLLLVRSVAHDENNPGKSMLNQTLNDAQNESVDVKEYLAILLKRKWLILVCFLLSMAFTTAFLFTRQPVYRANAKILVTMPGYSRQSSDVTVDRGDRIFYPTMVEVMRSQTMLRRVQQRLRKTAEEVRENLVRLNISRAGESDIVIVSVDSPSRDFAREFANAVCDEYLKFRDEERAQGQETALLGLTREINRLSQELKTANERILTFARQNNVALLERDPQLGQAEYRETLNRLQRTAERVTSAATRKAYLDSRPDLAGILAMLSNEAATGGGEPATGGGEAPLLAVGATISIEVEQLPALNTQAMVEPDGTINLGALGKVPAAGMSAAALSQAIQQKLEKESQIASAVRVTNLGGAQFPAGAELQVPALQLSAKPAPGPAMTKPLDTTIDRTMLMVLPDRRAEELYQLENQRKAYTARLTELQKFYRPKHPAVQQTTKALDEVNRAIDSAINYLREKAAADLQFAKDEYQRLQESIEVLKEDAMGANIRLMEISTLRSDAERVRSLYNALLGQLLKVDVLDRDARTVSVLEYAILQNEPVYPNKMKGLLLAAFVGLGLGLALAFFIEYIDDSIKLAEEVERDLQLPFLGMIPAAQWSPDDLTAHRLDKLKQQGGVAEAYRVVRSAIIFSTPREKLRSILLTSAVPREGKTTTCVNLSIGFAQIEERVLLIDADLRRGELHKYFGLDREDGLADVLLGEKTPDRVIRHTNVPKLDVMTTGVYPANPAELLLGWRLKELLDWAHKNYDRVIIDCPPVMGIADSAILGAAVDGVLFIIWAGRTSRRYVRVAKMTAVSRGAKIFGFVLNNLEPGRVGYYHYYPYYYSYYSRGYYYSKPDQDKDKGGDVKGVEVPTPEGGEEQIKDVY